MVRRINFNGMKKALIVAHNNNNRSAINNKIIEEAGVSKAVLDVWIEDIEALRKACVKYNTLSHDYSVNHDKAYKSKCTKARNEVYSHYKDMLAAGEDTSDSHNLITSDADVELVIGWALAFGASSVGTTMVNASEYAFRKNVEKLIGCKMAENSVLSDADRDAINAYRKACTSYKKYQDLVSTLDKQLDVYNNIIEKCSEDAKDIIAKSLEDAIKATKAERDEAAKKQTEAHQAIWDTFDKAHKAEAKLSIIGDVVLPLEPDVEAINAVAENEEAEESEDTENIQAPEESKSKIIKNVTKK